MFISKYIRYIFLSFNFLLFLSCNKYLSEKQDQKLVVPETITDLQSLLDNWFVINRNYPEAGNFSSDDYYFTYSDWSSQDDYIRRTYTWEKDYLFEAGSNNGWATCYNNVYIANTVLFYIDKIGRSPNDLAQLNNTKRVCLFSPGHVFCAGCLDLESCV